MRTWPLIILTLVPACIHFGKAAPPSAKVKRTPSLAWTFDDRLYQGAGTAPGEVLVGDHLVVQIDATQRFGDSMTAPDPANGFPTPYYPATGLVLDVPVGLRDFYFAARGNGYWLDDGTCTPGTPDPTARTAAAVTCSEDHERSKDIVDWPRVPASLPLNVWRCTMQRGLLLEAKAQRKVRLLEGGGAGPPDCVGNWTLKAHDDRAVATATVHVKTGAKRLDLAAQLVDGVWTVDTSLDVAGEASATVELVYKDGLTNQTALPPFEVKKLDDHSLVRIQPELMSSQDMRSVNLGVAITPVTRTFFDAGPWHGGKTWLNGVNPSAVIRFSGDDTTVLQFGGAVSLFANKSMLFNAGILFGTPDTATFWDWQPNLFVGFAIDPALLLEARTAGK